MQSFDMLKRVVSIVTTWLYRVNLAFIFVYHVTFVWRTV
jgi:hypothetical protein